MARQTKGKRTASKSAAKRITSRGTRRKMTSRRAFPGGAKKTEGEVARVVPRTRRS